MKRFALLILPILFLIILGVLLTYSLQPTGRPSSKGAPDPNGSFRWAEKTEYPLSLADDEVEYVFEGRGGTGQNPRKSIYDPANWVFTLFQADGNGKARFRIAEGTVETLAGYVREDGLFRVDSYQDIQGEPREFWQTLFNILFLLPRNKAEVEEPGEREIVFPSAPSHHISGTVRFEDHGTHRAGETQTHAFHVVIHIDVMTESRKDLLTEFYAEGRVYYDPAKKDIVAGEWEWVSGRINQIYTAGAAWNYVFYYRRGCKPEKGTMDYLSRSKAIVWAPLSKMNQREYEIRAFQQACTNKLHNMAEVQEVFRSHKLVDQDGDGKGEYGLLTEISGAARKLRAPGKLRDWPVERPLLKLRDSYGKVNQDGVSEIDQYRYKLFLAGKEGLISDDEPPRGDPSSADAQERDRGYCIYAWPARPGVTGEKVFFTNKAGEVWSTREPPFDVTRELPEPADTKRPKGGSWTLEAKGQTIKREYEIVTLHGEELKGEQKKKLRKIMEFITRTDLFHQDKALGDKEYRYLVKLSRMLLKARADGKLEDKELSVLVVEYGLVVSIVNLTVAETLLGMAEAKAKDRDMSRALKKERAALRKRLDTLRALDWPTPSQTDDLLADTREHLSQYE